MVVVVKVQVLNSAVEVGRICLNRPIEHRGQHHLQ